MSSIKIPCRHGAILSAVAVLCAAAEAAAQSGPPFMAWGKNTYGQTNVPPSATNLVAVDLGWQHALGLRADGTLLHWGYGDMNLAATPPGATNIVSLATGDYHNLALRADGVLFAWGKDEYGQLSVPASATNVVAIAGGYSHSLALRGDGTLVAWGDNTFGQTTIPQEATNVVSIAAGMDHCVALRGDGRVIVWGINQSGETNLPPAATNVVSISAGATHSLALRSDGVLVPWGSTVFGETTVPTNAVNPVAIASGGWFNLAALENGSAIGWGYDFSKQATPPSAITNPVAIYAGGEFGLAWLRTSTNGVGPRLWKDIPDRTVYGGQAVYLHPGVNGTPPLVYKWFFNNAPLPSQTNRWLSLPNASPTQSGTYFLVVSNNFGAITTRTATVSIPGIAFLQQPTNTPVVMNSDFVLSAAVAGTEPLTFQWFKDGIALTDTARRSGCTTLSLTNKASEGGDSGKYTLVVSNPGETATSAVAMVTVRVPEPLLNVDFGGSVPSPKTGRAAVGQGDADFWNAYPAGSMGISNLFLADGSQSGISVSITNNLFWNWIDYPDPMLREFVYRGDLGSSFAVRIFGLPPGTYSFFLYNAGVMYWPWFGSDFELIVGGVSLGHNILTGSIGNPPPWRETVEYGTFHNVQVAGPQQSVVLMVRGNFGQTPNIAGLQIGGFLTTDTAPLVWSQPVSQFVPVGTNFVLSSTASGFPSPSSQWYFNYTPLTNSARINGAQSNRLVVADAEFADAGDYYVVFTNSSGAATSLVASVAVGIPPGFVVAPFSQTWIAYTNATLTAQATGTEPLSYQWFKGGVALTNSARIAGAGSPMLTVTGVAATDAGAYSLQVTNPFGSISTTSQVAVVIPVSFTRHPSGHSVPPGMPLKLSAQVTGTSPITFQWYFNGNLLSGATTNALDFPVAENGAYRLVASNYAGAVTSLTAQVTAGPVAVWGAYFSAAIPIWPPPGISNIVSVAAGEGFSLALRSDGAVFGWGGVSSATNVPPWLNNVVAISASSHALALRADGTVVGWGSSLYGQTNVPAGLSNVVAISAGSLQNSTALLRDGTVVVWGGSQSAATNMPPEVSGITWIDSSARTLAVRKDGDVIGWGGGVVPPYLHGARRVAASITDIVGPAYNLALLTNGTVTAWIGTSVGGSPVGWERSLFPGLSNAVAIDVAGGGRGQDTGASGCTALVLDSTGRVHTYSGAGSSLTNVPAAVSNAVAISGGLTHALAILGDLSPLIIEPPVGGTFYSGDEVVLRAKAVGAAPLHFQWFKDNNPVAEATNETLILAPAELAHAGLYHLVATNEQGSARTVDVPVTVVDLAPQLTSQPSSKYAWFGSPLTLKASVIGSGPMQNTWRRDGVLIAEGTEELFYDRAMPEHGGVYQLTSSNNFGSVTSAPATLTSSKLAYWGGGPGLTNAAIDLGAVSGMAAGFSHNLALLSDGTVAAWGTTAGGITNPPAGLSNVIALAAGNGFSLALKSDGTIAAWGTGTSGQTSVPAHVTNAIAISCGPSHSLALLRDGSVAAWGTGNNGLASVPAGLSNVVAVSAGASQNLALKADGSVTVWGFVPTLPPPLSNIVAVAAGYSQSLALRSDGTVTAWTPAKASAPPADLSNVVAIASGGGLQSLSVSAALRADGSVVEWGERNNQVPQNLLSATALSIGSSGALALLNDRSPVITVQPWNRTVDIGSAVTLTAFAAGEPPLAYQWLFNSQPIEGANEPNLHIENIHPLQSGIYQLAVSNRLGANTSQTALVQVPIAAPILGQPARQGTQFRFIFASIQAVLYIVEYKDDLRATAWLELERRLGSGGVEIVVDGLANKSRFYRVRAIAASVPSVEGFSLASGKPAFSVNTSPNVEYAVQFKQRLTDTEWTTIQSFTGTGSPMVLTDTNAMGTSGFYRVILK